MFAIRVGKRAALVVLSLVAKVLFIVSSNRKPRLKT